ncbi:putative RNA polymerase sigma factor [Kaistia dalseonensis]|uniref:RNA polymerase sigma factor n=1 Tax=Kaistia dalseonensis TaxID=410840 RepID=A0ABU0HEF5_9HYPH|nr:DUF6596 domain-containing protein [Kaistia dalseonensis]MDQ0440233.1 putative RNA polymerase sigma factor [Kaistia dalseonensis]
MLGLDAARIATAFLIPASAMGQRLVRAKVKIRDAGIPFAVPEASELPVRLDSVLEAIYAAYGSGWDDVAGADERCSNLTREAIWLGRAIQSLLPEEPEVRGLLALMLYCEARRPARRTVTGDYVPLSEQDVSLWSRGMLHEAETILRAAATAKRPGRFQLEASLQSAHIGHRLIGEPDNAIIAQLHEALWRLAPRIGLAVARAVAWADSRGPEAGLALLDEIEPARVAAYQPYHAARAELLARSGQIDAARAHYATAIRLANDPAARRYLELRSNHLLS